MSEDLLHVLHAPIKEYAFPQQPVLIYGAGNSGREAARILSRHGQTVKGFIDEKFLPEGMDGKSCWRLADPELAALAKEGVPVLIGVFNFKVDTLAITRELTRLGFQRIISYYEFLELFGPFETSKYWFAPRGFFREFANQIMETQGMWADDLSRSLFIESLRLRCGHDLQALANPDRDRQYFPQDLPPIPEPVRWVDGGAYTGDSIEAMVKDGIRIEEIAAFEPDPSNYARLRETVSGLGLPLENLFSCGLGEKSGSFHFKSGFEAASGFAEEGELVKVVAMDEAIPHFRPTFIKLDIEGSEPAALKGAEGLIRNERPRLAICLYHTPSHLWELPALIKSLTPNYRYYLRYHGYNGFDLVAYAIPESDF